MALVEKAAQSRALYERAIKVMPGGNTRSQLYTAPHPLYVKRGEGARVTTVDGDVLDDFLLNYTAAAVGYRHPVVAEATNKALRDGASFGMPTEYEVAMAEALSSRVPAMERVRFTNSGSEATLHAIRTARAFTGRHAIAKAEGGYHGNHDLTDFSVRQFSGPPFEPRPETHGIPPGITSSTIVIPFNDLEGAVEVLVGAREQLAAVILEPFLNAGGVIPASTDYLTGIERWCTSNEVLFILDEVASFRTSFHGAQSDYKLRPDLVCLGKAIGGGFPVGAFGGRADVMESLDPRRDNAVRHAGTFNGHAVALAAGLAVLEVLDRDTIKRMNQQAEHIAREVREVRKGTLALVTATVYGSIGSIHNGVDPPTTARAAASMRAQMSDIYWELVRDGVLIAPRGLFSTSAVTSDDQVERLIATIRRACEAVFDPTSTE